MEGKADMVLMMRALHGVVNSGKLGTRVLERRQTDYFFHLADVRAVHAEYR